MTEFALHLAGAVALLLWAVRMIRTGIERAFARQLRAGLRRAGRTALTAAGGGATAAFFLQSSTAVAVLGAGFVAAGTLGETAGLALLLGADVGSGLVAQVLVFPAAAAVPALLLVGVALFLRGWSRRVRQLGRIVIGLGLVFLALDMIRGATAPLGDSEIAALVVGYLAGDLLSAFVIGALVAWAMHSSLAAVLTVVAFVAEGALPVAAGAALVLGANLGGAAIPVTLTLAAPAPARRIVLGNLLLRGGGALLALWALGEAPQTLAWLGATGAQQVIVLHLAFNVAVALVALPIAPLVLRMLALTGPRRAEAGRETRISALDEAALADPERALACGARELLRMGERVEGMLVPVLRQFRSWDEVTAAAIAEAERAVDRMHFDIKLYIARLQQQTQLEQHQARRAMNLATIATGLEEAGDQISSRLLGMARRMSAEGLRFSAEGWSDLEDFHDQVLGNAQLALNVLMTGDPEAARQIVEEKDRARRRERALQASHLERLRTGNPTSVETSNFHQEVLRTLKHVNTAFSMVAYPIAEASGDLLDSRLAAAAAAGSRPEQGWSGEVAAR